MTSRSFRFPIRIYWEDTDAQGIVYHANYLKFFERARTEWLRSLGYSQSQWTGPMIVIATITVAFHRPGKLDDELQVVTRLSECKRATLVFDQRLFRGEELLCSAQVRCATVDPEKGTPKAMTEPFYSTFCSLVEPI